MSINIKPSHKGLFTAKAKAAGKSVQEYANEEKGAGGKLGKEANFARMAKRHFKPLAKKGKKKSKYHRMAKAMSGKKSKVPMGGGVMDSDQMVPGSGDMPAPGY